LSYGTSSSSIPISRLNDRSDIFVRVCVFSILQRMERVVIKVATKLCSLITLHSTINLSWGQSGVESRICAEGMAPLVRQDKKRKEIPQPRSVGISSMP
jgi:hypothetical protein